MKSKIKDLKRNARENMLGNYSVCIGALVFAFLFVLIVTTIFYSILMSNPTTFNMVIFYVASILISMIYMTFYAGFLRMQLKVSIGENIRSGELFWAIKNNSSKYLCAGLGLTLIAIVPVLPGTIITSLAANNDSVGLVLIGTLILILGCIVTIILSLTFSQVLFLLIMHEDWKIGQAFSESASLMKGNKGRLFLLELSFIGLFLLGSLSFGLAYFWIYPYMGQTQALFYLEISGTELEYMDQPNNEQADYQSTYR